MVYRDMKYLFLSDLSLAPDSHMGEVIITCLSAMSISANNEPECFAVIGSDDTSILLPVTESMQGLKQKHAEARSTNKRLLNNKMC